MRRRRDHVLAERHVTDLGDLEGDFPGRQDPTVARLRALAELELDQLDLWILGLLCEPSGLELTRVVATTEIARADLPTDVTAALQVIRRQAALTGVVIKP